jgi:hypothetical protein
MKITKKKIITAVLIVILAVAGGVFFYLYIKRQPPFTQPEYIKEVVLQKDDFDDIRDNFLDTAEVYSGTNEDNARIIKLYNQAVNFVKLLNEKLGPKVPSASKEHFKGMMQAYQQYLNAMEIYKTALPKPLSDNRNAEIKKAKEGIRSANSAMLNLK